MSLIQNFQKLGHDILDLVFPISCLVCGREGVYLCETCTLKLPRLENQLCVACYRPAPYGKTHPECRTRNTVDGAVAALSYKDRRVQKIIETFKYNFVANLAIPLSNIIVESMEAQGLSEYFAGFAVVPVPLHRRRMNWRGFNQSELLARSLADKLQASIRTDLVARTKFTEPQVNLKAESRRKNIANAFELTAGVAGQKILLVDDLVTSGSTANELAKLFKKEKAAEVWIISAAHG